MFSNQSHYLHVGRSRPRNGERTSGVDSYSLFHPDGCHETVFKHRNSVRMGTRRTRYYASHGHTTMIRLSLTHGTKGPSKHKHRRCGWLAIRPGGRPIDRPTRPQATDHHAWPIKRFGEETFAETNTTRV